MKNDKSNNKRGPRWFVLLGRLVIFAILASIGSLAAYKFHSYQEKAAKRTTLIVMTKANANELLKNENPFVVIISNEVAYKRNQKTFEALADYYKGRVNFVLVDPDKEYLLATTLRQLVAESTQKTVADAYPMTILIARFKAAKAAFPGPITPSAADEVQDLIEEQLHPDARVAKDHATGK